MESLKAKNNTTQKQVIGELIKECLSERGEAIKEEIEKQPPPAPRHMQDGSTAVLEQLEAINLSDDPATQKHVFINTQFRPEEHELLIGLLKEYKNVFA